MKIDWFLFKEWYAIHRAIGRWPDLVEFKKLRAAYSEDGRHYHTWQHVYECIKFVNIHYGNAPGIHLVKFALFYHDAEYNVMAKDNEEQSAWLWELYSGHMTNADTLTLKDVFFVKEMILTTKHHRLDVDAPLLMKMMMDADMHIFLCPDSHYLEYARGIWKEYSVYGRETFIENRLKFLQSLDPYHIFYTHQARELVHHAVANIDLEITILTSEPDRICV